MDDVELRRVRRTPSAFLALASLAFPVGVCGIAGHTDSTTRIAVEAGVLALLVAVVGFDSTVPAGLIATVVSVLSLNGFTEDAYGRLGWHPGVDLRVTAVLGAALGVGWLLRGGVDNRPSRESSYWSQELSPEDGDR